MKFCRRVIAAPEGEMDTSQILENTWGNDQTESLARLVEINTIINSTLDIKKLLNIIMEIIKEIVKAEASTLLLYDESSDDLVFKVALGGAGEELTEKYRVRMGQGIAGHVAKSGKSLIVNDVYSDDRFDPNYDRATGFVTKSIMCAPLLHKGKLLGVIQAINAADREGFAASDSAVFSIFADQAALAVQNAVYFQKAIEEERLKAEVEGAVAVNEVFGRSVSVRAGGLSAFTLSKPARELGGVLHGGMEISEEVAYFYIGDVSRKGIPGALAASSIRGALSSLPIVPLGAPSRIFQLLRKTMIQLPGAAALSGVYGFIDGGTQSVSFVTAGNVCVILKRIGNEAKMVFQSGPEEPGYGRVITVKMKPGDCLAAVTGGVFNIRNRSGRKLSKDVLLSALAQQVQSVEEGAGALLKAAEDFAEGLAVREDLAVAAVKLVQ